MGPLTANFHKSCENLGGPAEIPEYSFSRHLGNMAFINDSKCSRPFYLVCIEYFKEKSEMRSGTPSNC